MQRVWRRAWWLGGASEARLSAPLSGRGDDAVGAWDAGANHGDHRGEGDHGEHVDDHVDLGLWLQGFRGKVIRSACAGLVAWFGGLLDVR